MVCGFPSWLNYGRPIGQAILFSSCGFFFLSFSPRLFSAIGDRMFIILPHMNACLKCAERGSPKIQDAKITQKMPSAHRRTTLSGHRNQSMYRQSEKMVKRQYLLHMPSQYDELRPTSSSCWWVWGNVPQQISTSFASWFRYCTDVAQRKSTKLCTTFHRLLGWYTVYAFSGALAR